MIHIYYGNGKGKTTCAIGVGMRAYGSGLKVSMVQFLKNNKSSELSVLPFKIFESPEFLPFNPDLSYQNWIDNALKFIKTSNCDVLILDEFLDIIPKFLSVDMALDLLDKNKEIIITGHKEVKELLDVADYVSNVKKIKHPYDCGVGARIGIEY